MLPSLKLTDIEPETFFFKMSFLLGPGLRPGAMLVLGSVTAFYLKQMMGLKGDMRDHEPHEPCIYIYIYTQGGLPLLDINGDITCT